MSLMTYIRRKLCPPYVPPALISMDPYEQLLLDRLRLARERRAGEVIVPTVQRSLTPAERALLQVVAAVRDYLPPDGIPEQTFISRVIGAVDNPYINPVIRRLEK